MVDSPMMEAGDIQSVVSLEGVRVDNAVGSHLLLDDGQKGLRFGIGDDGRVDPPSPLQQAEHRHFASRAAAPSSFAVSPKVALVRLDLSGQLETGLLAGNESAKTHEEPDRRVGLNPRQLRCRSRGCSGDKQLDQLALLLRHQAAFSGVHRSYHNPL